MVGWRLLARVITLLVQKHGDPSVPFCGLDIIFFGDFIQFPPVLDTPLYFASTRYPNPYSKRYFVRNKK